MRTRLLVLALAPVLALGLAACSDDGGSDNGGGDGTTINVTSAPPGATEEKKYVPANGDGTCPDDHPVKAVEDPSFGGRIYATPDMSQYDRVRAGFCFETVEAAKEKDFKKAS